MKPIPADWTTSNPREIALAVLQHFQDRDTDASQLLHDLLRRGGLHGADSRLATELTMGVLRRRMQLDAILKRMTRRPWSQTPPIVRDILQLGAYQMLFMDRIPPHAAVNESVALARRWAGKNPAGLVNAILRRLAVEHGKEEVRGKTLETRDKGVEGEGIKAGWAKELARRFSHPLWLVNYLLSYYSADQTEALLEWNNQTPALMLRVNRRRIEAAALAEQLAASGLTVSRIGWPVPESLFLEGPVGDIASAEWYRQGLATVQDGAAQLIAHWVAPRPGERILDWCAGPGGKTTHLAELSDDRAEILALDVDARRLEQVALHAQRLGLRSIQTLCIRPSETANGADAPPHSPAFAPADAVLVDAPCSGLGTIQRHPDIRWRRTMRDIQRAAQRQLEILSRAAQHVAPGGRLIYSTCTLGPIENEDVVERFLAAHPHFARADARFHTEPYLQPFLDSRGDLRTWPPEHHLDGFYAAKMVRAK
ncbi:MAG: 16S rRNA (cytosine(967)-C(5))-methyltransferase RsmB [Candidatus Sumerlaeia bacterium]|nr:16S rRNA (cytosine(967)-C(5))-methyltransferase RsmB [Candidatus Sumerlaeia bacterium]